MPSTIIFPVVAFCMTFSATAIATPKTAPRALSCGPATVTATSTTDPHVPPNDDFAWLAQKLTLTEEHGRQAIPCRSIRR